ncbi:MAG: bifunctional adenosylcobinamide kinase/adenosylcobinamide-phosphate guanylyltransferase [Bacteroidota bacterium]
MFYFVTGGTRSGKSRYAMDLALSLSDNPMYVATARIWDEDFADRVKRHESDRDDRWQLLEEEKYLSSNKQIEERIVLVDCLTLWITNFFTDSNSDIDYCLAEIKKELDLLVTKASSVVLISNEIGMGMHADTDIGRKFADLQGWANQYAAQKADEVIFMVSGLPMTVKSSS